jgi:serine/threonine protein kinase
LGTPNFIAPEQFGDAKNASIRCDIYSLGATLYMALTGQLPFAGSNLSSIMKLKLANDFVMPRTLVPALSERAEWAVRRAIQADPSRRYATCPEFIAALTDEEPSTSSDGKPRIASPNAGGKRQGAGKERRTARRFECALPTSCVINISVHEEATNCEASWDAQAYSLSVNGVGFHAPRRFEPGSLLSVVLTSRCGKVTAGRQMRVVRVTPADGAGWLLAGMLTENLSKEELRNLL